MGDMISRQAAIDALKRDEALVRAFGYQHAIDAVQALPSAQPEQQNKRIFQGIIVEYPTISTYPEHEGKPYFSIKYTENGQEFIGYGTYKPEVLSEYLKEYFMPSAQPEHTVTHSCDYQRTGTHEPQRMRGKWETIEGWDGDEVYRCSECEEEYVLIDGTPKENGYNFCPNCGAKLVESEVKK